MDENISTYRTSFGSILHHQPAFLVDVVVSTNPWWKAGAGANKSGSSNCIEWFSTFIFGAFEDGLHCAPVWAGSDSSQTTGRKKNGWSWRRSLAGTLFVSSPGDFSLSNLHRTRKSHMSEKLARWTERISLSEKEKILRSGERHTRTRSDGIGSVVSVERKDQSSDIHQGFTFTATHHQRSLSSDSIDILREWMSECGFGERDPTRGEAPTTEEENMWFIHLVGMWCCEKHLCWKHGDEREYMRMKWSRMEHANLSYCWNLSH